MIPSRTLDALVAVKVMGFSDAQILPEPDFTGVQGGERKRIPNYSTSIEAAWEVVEKMSEKYAYCIEKSTSEHDVTVWFVAPQGPGFHSIEEIQDSCSAASCSVAHAICLAALKAVGVEV